MQKTSPCGSSNATTLCSTAHDSSTAQQRKMAVSSLRRSTPTTMTSIQSASVTYWGGLHTAACDKVGRTHGLKEEKEGPRQPCNEWQKKGDSIFPMNHSALSHGGNVSLRPKDNKAERIGA